MPSPCINKNPSSNRTILVNTFQLSLTSCEGEVAWKPELEKTSLNCSLMKGDRSKLRLVHHWSIEPENTKNAANMAQKMTPTITPLNIISNEISPQTRIAKYLAIRNILRVIPSDRNLHKESTTKLGVKSICTTTASNDSFEATFEYVDADCGGSYGFNWVPSPDSFCLGERLKSRGCGQLTYHQETRDPQLACIFLFK